MGKIVVLSSHASVVWWAKHYTAVQEDPALKLTTEHETFSTE